MRQKYFFMGFMLLQCCRILAQAEPQFTQHMYHPYLFNSATAGSDDALQFSLLHRSQYVGLADRFIASQAFNFNLPVYAISSGLGLTVINDFIGYQRSTYVRFDYDYRKTFKWGKMGVGISAGIIQTALDGAKLRAPDGDYSSGVNHHDDAIPVTMQNGIAPDFSVGIYFNNARYFAGAAVNHIILSQAPITTANGRSKLFFPRNIFFTGGYNFLINQKLSIMPSAIIKSDLKKVQTDLSLNFTVINNILTGLSFRGYSSKTVDAVALFLGLRYKGLQVVYAYDANVSSLTKFNSGSHEISLSYRYPLQKKEKKGYFYYNPRFNETAK